MVIPEMDLETAGGDATLMAFADENTVFRVVDNIAVHGRIEHKKALMWFMNVVEEDVKPEKKVFTVKPGVRVLT